MMEKAKTIFLLLAFLAAVCIASAVTVTNHSFEDGATGWTGTDGNGGAGSGVFQSISPPDGNGYYWLGETHVLYQTTSVVCTAGSAYTLTVAVRDTWYANPRISLYCTDDGGATRTTIGSAFYLTTDFPYLDGTNGIWDAYHDLELTVVIPAEAAGKNLGIALDIENPPGQWAHFDNVRLENTAVTLVSPPNGEENVGTNAALNWTVGPSVEFIDLYFGLEDDPNLMLYPLETLLDEPATTTSYSPTMDYNTTYYWKVIGYEPNTLPGATDYFANDSGTWSFTTVPEVPIVNPVTPAYQAVDAGQPTVELSVTSFNVETFEWYKVGDPTPLTDQAGVYSGTDTDTLTISDVQLADEGYYYCVGYNFAGSDSSIDSTAGEGAGRVMIHRLTSHWPLDSDYATVVDGNDVQIDIVDGYDMVLASGDNGTDYPTLTTNVVDPVVGDESLLFNNSNEDDPNNAWGQYALVEPGVAGYEDITIALWVLWDGGGNWQRILDFGNGTGEYMFLSPNAAGTNLRFVINDGGEQNVQTELLPTSEWTHVTVTLNGDTARMYVNGELVATNDTFANNPIGVNMATNYVGDSQYVDDPFFNGLIDDLKIYNYARTTEQIALDYLAVRGEYVCNNEVEALLYDYNNDCQTNLEDFAIFVVEWLDSYRIYAD